MTTEKQRYYKVLTKDLKAPNQKWFSYEDWQRKTFKVKGSLEMCANGLHLYTSLEDISIGIFGERVFEAEPIGEYISDRHKVCCREVKLLKKVKPEEVKDSRWLYNYCCYVKDRPEVYRHITDSKWLYYYCRYVKDRPEIYKRITNPKWIYHYCCNVKDRPKIYKKIINSEWAYRYCFDIKDRPEVYKNITESEWAYWYCRNIKNRPEVHKYIIRSNSNDF